MTLIVPFVWAARMFEMRFGASMMEKIQSPRTMRSKASMRIIAIGRRNDQSCAFGDDRC